MDIENKHLYEIKDEIKKLKHKIYEKLNKNLDETDEKELIESLFILYIYEKQINIHLEIVKLKYKLLIERDEDKITIFTHMISEKMIHCNEWENIKKKIKFNIV